MISYQGPPDKKIMKITLMKTHCPQCETMFRVTEEQVDLANGYVRCGVCQHVFNVFDVSRNFDLDDDHQLPVDAPDSPDENNTSASDRVHDDNLDFFDEKVASSLPHVVPEKFRRPYTSFRQSAMSTVLWSIGTLILAASLFLEYIWFNRYQYYQSPELLAVINTLCQQFTCDKLSMRDPANIELIARNVYTHPGEKDALMIDVTMKNNARFSQPYPVISIRFSDLRGNLVASRNFLPGEYRTIDNNQDTGQQQAMLRPESRDSLTLEILDPGKQATTYEFNFL